MHINTIYVSVGLIIIAYIIYAPITDIWSRYISNHIIRHGPSNQNRIALTFDDGPNPRYTPLFLDILKAHGVKAAFFLIGEQAKRHPDIVQRILKEGHLIGTHTQKHHHAYLRGPRAARNDIMRGIDAVGRASGTQSECEWFRPPWGAFNLSSRWTMITTGLRPVLWTVTGDDWKSHETEDGIVSKVTHRLHPGAIVVLHDSGGPVDAPQKTLDALVRIIVWAKDNDYCWDRLDRMLGANANEGSCES